MSKISNKTDKILLNYSSPVSYSLNPTGPTRTPTPTRTSSPTYSRESSARSAAARAARSACHEPADLSADFCPTRAFPREDVYGGCARVHVYVYCT